MTTLRTTDEAIEARRLHLSTTPDLSRRVYSTYDVESLPESVLRYERVVVSLITPYGLRSTPLLRRVRYEREVCGAVGARTGGRVRLSVRYRAGGGR